MYGLVSSPGKIEVQLPLPSAGPGDGVSAIRGEAVEVRPGTPAKAAFRSITSACLHQIIANKPAVLAGDPEGIHQMRIGLRRLRAAISLFSDIVTDAKTPGIRAELKWLTNELGPAREFEVFLTRVVAPIGKQHMRLAGMRSLSNDLADRRSAAIARASAAASSPRFHALTRNIVAWLQTGGWREPHDRLVRERGEAPIETMACDQLNRRWKKIRKRGRLLAKLDPDARHRLRIQAKKLRYATEFYKAVFPGKKNGKRRAAFLSSLKDMQDCLGELNDIFVHEKLAAGLTKTTVTQAAKVFSSEAGTGSRKENASKQKTGRILAAELLTGHEAARFEPVLTAAEHAFRTFAKLEPYWD